MKKKKIFMFITVFVLVLALLPLSASAEAPQMMGIQRPYNWDSSYGIYYLQGKPIKIETSYLGGTPTSVSVTWCDVPVTQLSVNINSSTGDITGSFVPDEYDFLPGEYIGNQQLYGSPGNIKITISNTDGSASRERAGYVTKQTRSEYESVDPNFYYHDEYTNYFVAIATEEGNNGDSKTYNCLAYVIDDYSHWRWPFSSTTPSLATIEAYMKGETRTYGTMYYNSSTSWVPYQTKVIYYDNGHFAKVVSYGSDGSPSVIMSKWGSFELIRSDSYDPFSNVYGNAVLFFH